MNIRTASLLACLLACMVPLQALAHRAWIYPAITVVSSEGAWVTFDAAISNDIFHTDHAAMRLDGLTALTPAGETIELQNPHTGKMRSTFDLQLTETGTYKIYSASQGLSARWVDENGERRFWPGRGERPAPGDFEAKVPKAAKDLVVSQSSRRIETFVTAGTPTNGVFEGDTAGLTLQPVTHPNDLFAEETAGFRLLIDGEPAAGATISVLPGGMRYRNNQNEISIETGADGSFSITWPTAGMYWLNASYRDDKAPAPATVRQGSYTATFEVLPQ